MARADAGYKAPFEKYLDRWNLIEDGVAIATGSSDLLPVLPTRSLAMLKIAKCAEERLGNALMVWWNGEGAARVFIHDGEALLLERATGEGSLTEMARNGRDSEASRIACTVAEKLHVARSRPMPNLIPLAVWFGELSSAASRYGGILEQSLQASQELLAGPGMS